MRKAQKQQVEDLLGQMKEAQGQIKKYIGQGNIPQAMELLEDCQNGAITIGTLIENTEYEGHPTVSLLEAYCELIYRIYQKLEENNKEINTDKCDKQLRQKLLKVVNSVKNDISTKTEVVFLPYKASMWDSLESVWKAADEDPDCDAYVIPIPYYDKNPDGSFGEMHYEGNQYPDYVPIISYEAYDLQTRRPDAIYIHNPYDECNYVTSVHPSYYSKKLKEHTEKLVYIPYFILGEISPDNQEAVEGMKHFCLVPGVMNADKVIVQSEDMRLVYIKVLTEAFGKETGDYWSKKILGLGSPKVDKVLNTRKEDLEIPKEWFRIIRRPDGKWKKIILYNTGVSALLQYNEHMLAKIQNVLGIFWENRDEVALLWRPHPLIKATISSMRPKLWAAYEMIVERYRREGWGIYDDTADVDRAVVLSDAYYGDGSSVVQLYRKTGKFTLLQNVHSLPENNYSLAMDNIVEYRGEWWFLALKDNGIYRMNKETFEAALVVRIPWDDHSWMPQYGKIYIYKNKIFIIPWVPIKIAVYNMEAQRLYYLDYEKETVNRGMVFCEGIIDGNKLYLIPCAYENILCINMDSEEIEYIRLDEALHEKRKKHLYAWGGVFFDKKTIYMTMLDSDRIIGYELKTDKVDVYQSKLLTGGGAGICGDEDNVWIVPKRADRIIHWDKKRKTADIIKGFPKGYQPGEFSFYKLQSYKENLYLLPRGANMVIVFNKDRRKIGGLKLGEVQADTKNFYDKYFRYANVWEEQGNTYLVQASRGEVYCVGVKDGKVEFTVKQIKVQEKCDETVHLSGGVECENRFDNITNYLVMLNCMEKKAAISTRQMVGTDIWRCLR